VTDPARQIGPIGNAGAPAPAARPLPGPPAGPAFGDVLAAKLRPQAGPLRFSGHALERLERRGIVVDDASLARLAEGVGRLAAKGARASLVLVDDKAFVVSVPNRTVVTAVDAQHMREQVFTNIDSAVIA